MGGGGGAGGSIEDNRGGRGNKLSRTHAWTIPTTPEPLVSEKKTCVPLWSI